jgi:hypothetical protein
MPQSWPTFDYTTNRYPRFDHGNRAGQAILRLYTHAPLNIVMPNRYWVIAQWRQCSTFSETTPSTTSPKPGRPVGDHSADRPASSTSQREKSRKPATSAALAGAPCEFSGAPASSTSSTCSPVAELGVLAHRRQRQRARAQARHADTARAAQPTAHPDARFARRCAAGTGWSRPTHGSRASPPRSRSTKCIATFRCPIRISSATARARCSVQRHESEADRTALWADARPRPRAGPSASNSPPIEPAIVSFSAGDGGSDALDGRQHPGACASDAVVFLAPPAM